MPFTNVVQILNVGRKSGVLGVQFGEQSGGLYLENGEAVHAWTDHSTGELAFYTLSGWTSAKFGFSSSRKEDQRTLRLSTMSLLMESMRRLDKKSAGSGSAPDVELDQLFPTE